MSRRSHGRPTPSRGARVERRKKERAARAAAGPARMVVPDAIQALAAQINIPRRKR